MVKDQKVNWEWLSAIETRTVTTGEVNGHLIGFGSVEEIAISIQCLLEDKLSARLAKAPLEAIGAPRDLLEAALSDVEKSLRSIATLFTVRHACANEIVPPEVPPKELRGFFLSVQSVLESAEVVYYIAVESSDFRKSMIELSEDAGHQVDALEKSAKC